MSNVPKILSAKDKIPLLEKVIGNQIGAGTRLNILEAGCGQRWLLKLDSAKIFLTGIDLDAQALQICKEVRRDLDEAIHGDLRTVAFGDRRFGVIYSAFVLEHIAGAEDVLARMCSWLAPNGLIILEIPDPDSVKGLVTRVTPHWFHVFYYRYVLGIRTAGNPGHGPYRTYFDRVVSRRGMHDFCARRGLVVEEEVAFATDGPRGRSKRLLIAFLTKMISVASLGAFSDRHADLLYVLRRPS
jgi:SAM-dependent methyltransferase